jgi:hypothetical protein
MTSTRPLPIQNQRLGNSSRTTNKGKMTGAKPVTGNATRNPANDLLLIIDGNVVDLLSFRVHACGRYGHRLAIRGYHAGTGLDYFPS